MKWVQDLVRDIRSNSGYDNHDSPDFLISPNFGPSDCNLAAVAERFSSMKTRCRAILDIGMLNQSGRSITELLLHMKSDDTAYVGVCVHDRSYMNNPAKNIFVTQEDPGNIVANAAKIRSLAITEFDFIFINDWNSINRALENWEYSRYLSDDGVIAFMNTSIHPGPFRLTNSLNRDKWIVEYNVCPGNDWGIGFVRKNVRSLSK